MARFPLYTEINYSNPLVIELETKTMFSNFDDLGAEQRKRKRLYPLRNFTLAYKGLTDAQARTLWQFYQSRTGPYQSFNFFLSHPTAVNNSYTDEYVGTGDGTTQIFNLPCRNASSYTVKVGGVIKQASGVEYTFSAMTGTDGADVISFLTPPENGTRILVSFTGQLKIRCRFEEDRLSWETFYARITNMGIRCKGLLNE